MDFIAREFANAVAQSGQPLNIFRLTWRSFLQTRIELKAFSVTAFFSPSSALPRVPIVVRIIGRKLHPRRERAEISSHCRSRSRSVLSAVEPGVQIRARREGIYHSRSRLERARSRNEHNVFQTAIMRCRCFLPSCSCSAVSRAAARKTAPAPIRISLCVSVYPSPSHPPPVVSRLRPAAIPLSHAHSKQMSRYDSLDAREPGNYRLQSPLPRPRATSTFARCHVKSSPDEVRRALHDLCFRMRARRH